MKSLIELRTERTTVSDLTRFYGTRPLIVVKAKVNPESGKMIPLHSIIRYNENSDTGFIQIMQRYISHGLNYSASTDRFTIHKGKEEGLLSLIDTVAEPISYIENGILKPTHLPVRISDSKDKDVYLAYYALPGNIVTLEFIEGTVPDQLVKKFLLPDVKRVPVDKIQAIIDSYKKRRDKTKPFYTVGGKCVYSFKLWDMTGQVEDIIIKNYDEQPAFLPTNSSKPDFNTESED